MGHYPSWLAPRAASALTWLWLRLADRDPVNDRLSLCTRAHIFFKLQLVLPVRDSRDRLTYTHCLFSDNHFVYTGGTSVPEIPN